MVFAPRTWSVGETVTAAQLNNELRNPLLTLLADTGWLNASLASNWTNAPGYTTRYRRINGIVEVNGMIVRGASAGTTFFTLAPGYRPSQTVILGGFFTSDGVGYDLFASTTGDVGFASSGYVTGSTTVSSSHPISGRFFL